MDINESCMENFWNWNRRGEHPPLPRLNSRLNSLMRICSRFRGHAQVIYWNWGIGGEKKTIPCRLFLWLLEKSDIWKFILTSFYCYLSFTNETTKAAPISLDFKSMELLDKVDGSVEIF